jgi:hypothetical protein
MVSAQGLEASVAWRAMRKLSLLTLILAILVVAGCGDSAGGSEADSPLDNALRYLPADAPFAVAIETDTEGDQLSAASGIVDRFAFGDMLKERLKGEVEDRAGTLERIEKALGNEFVVGSTDAKSFVETQGDKDTRFVGAIQAKSEDALDGLLEDEKLEQDGESNGAKLYKDDSGDSFAVDGDVLVVAGSKQELEDALATRDGDDQLTEEDFDAGTEGVPADALARVYLDVGGLLRASPDAKDALKSKWVSAVRTAGIALSLEQDEVAIDFEVTTDPDGLTDADLPIASGAAAPRALDRDGEIGVALRNPAQLLDFAQATAKAIDPNGFSGFETGKAQIERRLKIDVDEDLLGQLEDDLAVSIDLDGKFGARAELKDPAAFERTLTKLEEVLPSIAEGATGEKVGFAKPKAGEDFYAIATRGGDRIVFGVVDGVFVLSNDAAIAATLAADRTRAVPGAKGALAIGVDAEQLAQPLLDEIEGLDFGLDDYGEIGKSIGRRIRGTAVRPLDDLTGSVEATTGGLSGSLRLTLDER